MKKFKKMLGLTLAAVLTVSSLTACGTKKDSTDTPPETNQENPSDDVNEQEGTDNTASGNEIAGAKDVFVIGGTGPLTGDAASYGNSVKNGAQIAIDEINAAGGINGMKFELKFLDDEAKAQPAITSYNKLMDEGIDAFLGTTTSASCEAIIELTNQDGILQVTPSASSIDAMKFPNSFRICFTDPLQGITMADYAMDTLGYKNMAVIYNVGDSYSSGMAQAFIDQVEAKGGTMSAKESFADGDVDFNTQLTTIQNSGAEVLFMPIYYQQVAYIANQAAAKGMTMPLIGGDGWDGVLGQLEDASVVEGAIFLSPFASNDPAENVQKFVTSYQAAYNSVPDQFAADAYDGVYVIKAAIEKAGSIDSAAMISAMTEISVDGLTGSMTFTPEGEPNKAAKLIEIKNGEYTVKK